MHDNIKLFHKFSLLLFSRWAGTFPHDDELGLFQTSMVKSQPIIVIDFFSRWVGYCRRAGWEADPQYSRVVMIKLISSLLLNWSSLLLFSRWAGAFQHIDELGLFQTSWEKCQPTILIVNLSFCIFQMSWPWCRRAGWGGWPAIFSMLISPSVIWFILKIIWCIL